MKKHRKAGQSFEGMVKKFVGSKNFAKLARSEKETIREISQIQEEVSKRPPVIEGEDDYVL